MRSQQALGASAKQALEGAQWQFYPTPSVGFEQVDASAGDPNYPSYGDKNVTTLRLQQPLWTGGRLSAGLDKAQAGVVATSGGFFDMGTAFMNGHTYEVYNQAASHVQLLIDQSINRTQVI
jgi:hypothetical protein